eukprot:TRINITY_DN8063_c0_g1_i1.p1 TRINITY_DN8063_c0_g1~~TRINITY_DN8063_c0_g1_i1.p1  ORF type:complete len:666 (+),score=156.02 TRINITY_DN8063_c0_g1_i1:114-2111(+)
MADGQADPLHEDGPPSDVESDEDRAGHVYQRRPTDVICLLVFAAAMVPFFYIANYAREEGDIRKITHGYDFLGRLCGVDYEIDPVTGENVTLGEVLYWCPKSADTWVPSMTSVSANMLGTSLDTMHPICVHECPGKEAVAAANTTRCFQGSETEKGTPSADGTFKAETTYYFAQVAVYESSAFAGRYCFPKADTFRKSMLEAFESNPAAKWLISLTSVWNARWALAMSALLAFVLGFAYLFVIDWFARPIVYTCMAILVLLPLAGGGYMVYASQQEGGMDGLPSTGDSQWDLITGCSLLAVSLVFAILACCSISAMETAIGCVQAACECIFSMPTLLIQPVISLAVHGIVMCFLMYGFFLLVSCGEVKQTSLEAYVAVSGYDVSGVMRSFTFTKEQLEYLFYYIFILFWFSELCTATSQFVLSYAVQLWYFTPYDDSDNSKDTPSCPLARGYAIALTYHLGTMIFGSLIIAIFRLIRMILHFVFKQAKTGENQALNCLAKCCECCMACFENCIRFLNKNAYMDVAINSTDFCHAARNAMSLIAGMLPELAILNGATWVVFIAGLGSITALGSFLTWEIVQRVAVFSDSIEHPDTYVADPVSCTVCAGVISFIIAFAFMIVFDSTADTIIYCYETERKRRALSPPTIDPNFRYAPETLQGMIKSDA